MRIVVAPGQGSQTPGFLIPWIEDVPGFRHQLEHYAEIVDLDLVRLGTEANEEEIKDTAVAQPLIVAASLAAHRTLLKNLSFDAVAGHSVGEFTAAAISGVLTDAEALVMVSTRALAMAKAAAMIETSMAAVIGGDSDELAARLSELGLQGANYNGAGQVVVAGLKSAVTELVANPPEKARVIELRVAGAFHTNFMESAQLELAQLRTTLTGKTPIMKLYSNQDGQLVTDGEKFLDLLVSQVTNPVRWDKVMAAMQGHNAEIVELPPAGALSGLLKRGVEDCRTVPLRAPQDFEKVEA
jgi:[acyl-carrier-protein] S-malonyltransferase